MKFISNITLGNPRKIIPSSFWAIIDGIFKIIPSLVILQMIQILYTSTINSTPIVFKDLYLWAFALVGWLILQIVASSFAYDTSFLAAYNVSASGRIKLADNLRNTSLGFLQSRDPADLTTMMLSDTVETTISHLVPNFISALGIPILTFIVLFFVHPLLASSLLITMPFAAIIIYFTRKLQVKVSINHIKAKVEAANRLQEYLMGIKEIKAHKLGGAKFARLDKSFK